MDVNIVRNDVLDLDAFRKWMPEYQRRRVRARRRQIRLRLGHRGKMSKSMYNVVNPDYIVR